MQDIKELVKQKDTTSLFNLFQAPHWLAFYDIDYGCFKGGAFTAACFPEALHGLENGFMLHCLKEVFSTILSPIFQQKLDKML